MKPHVMPAWKPSRMDWVDDDGSDAGESEPCEVRIQEAAGMSLNALERMP
jgi:hypothetical protein